LNALIQFWNTYPDFRGQTWLRGNSLYDGKLTKLTNWKPICCVDSSQYRDLLERWSCRITSR